MARPPKGPRISQRGNGIFQIVDADVRRSTGTRDPAEAKKLFDNYKADLLSGVVPTLPTIGDLLDDFLTDGKTVNRWRHEDDIERKIKHIKRHIGNILLSKTNTKLFRFYKEKRRQEGYFRQQRDPDGLPFMC